MMCDGADELIPVSVDATPDVGDIPPETASADDASAMTL